MENNSNQKQDCPLVFVRCLTFNHEAYIEDALNGFVMQQTNFPFVVTIVNDASPDNTKNVIEKFITNICESSNIIHEQTSYADIIKATPKENPNCLLFILNLYENHFLKKSHRPYYQEYVDKAKYWAECEGDDYWIDPHKLQKQVDFMEANPEYSMCFHGAEIINESATQIIIQCQNIEDKEYFTNDIFPNWIVPTASVLYRRSMVESFPKLKNPNWIHYDDIVLFLKCTHVGRVWGMKEHMSVYRMTSNGFVVAQCMDPIVEEKICKHHQFLMMNFPQLDKKWPSEYIAKYNYTKFRQTKGVLNKLKALCMAFRFSPKIVFQKFASALKRA